MAQTLPWRAARPWERESGWSAGTEGESQSAPSQPLPGSEGSFHTPDPKFAHGEVVGFIPVWVAAKRRALELGSGLGQGEGAPCAEEAWVKPRSPRTSPAALRDTWSVSHSHQLSDCPMMRIAPA